MSTFDRLKALHLIHLSKPVADRPVYREIQRLKARSILEIGIGTGQRSLRMIQLASHSCPLSEIRFTGVDLFEGRSATDRPGLSLKAAHCLLKPTGARILLVPGTPYDALARVANSLGKVDVLVLAPGPEMSLTPAWFYIPRLLDEHSRVLLETSAPGTDTVLRLVERAEIERLATSVRHRAA
ncbi:MAG: hypothetical protein ABSG68_08800 [Thermoguttaceae bacterium]